MLLPSRIHLARAGLLLFLVGLWQLLWVWGLPAYVLGPVDIVKHFYAALGSEEHTSELQSRPHLVCPLLLVKKKLAAALRPLACVHPPPPAMIRAVAPHQT